MKPRALIALACLAMACDVADSASVGGGGTIGPQSPPVGGGGGGTPVMPGEIIDATRIQEDFDSRQFIDTTTVAILDVNRGQVSLPSVTIPPLDSTAPDDVHMVRDYMGVVEAGTILVQDEVAIEGSDSVELRAKGELRIIGEVRAGPGGVTLIAGEGIRIDGVVESEGPVRLRVASESGVVEVSGRIATLSTSRHSSAPISILSRGRVSVTGVVETGDGMGADSGPIEITTYGPVQVTGGDARLQTGATEGGRAGRIDIATEARVDVLDGAQLVGGHATNMEERRLPIAGGTVSVRASEVEIGSSARAVGGTAVGGDGGSVKITTVRRVVLGVFAELRGGSGEQGGDVELACRDARLNRGSTAAGGSGDSTSGRVFIDAAGDVDLDGFTATGGSGNCAAGGPVLALVGGKLTVSEQDILQGGPGGTDVGEACLGGFPGGDVTIFARQTAGPLDEVTVPGTGTPDGETRVQVDPDYERDVPGIAVRPTGWVVSRTIDRGERARHLRPRLIELRSDEPDGTLSKIQLSFADSAAGVFGEWHDATIEQPELLEPLIGARYVRFRVWLQGRALDTPVVDGFDLDLAPF